MGFQQPPKQAIPLADAEAGYFRALRRLKRAAIDHGANRPGSVLKAQRANDALTAALTELRRSERAQARLHSINGLNAHLAGALHSANARGNHEVDWPAEIKAAFEALRNATW